MLSSPWSPEFPLGIGYPTLAARILNFGFAGWWLLNVRNGGFSVLSKLNAITQVVEVAQSGFFPPTSLHFPYQWTVEPDAPL